MKPAAALGFLLTLGIWVGHAFAAAPGPTQLPTTTLPITTALQITTVLPLPTTSVRLPTTTTVPKLPTTTTVPKLPLTTTTTSPTLASPIVTTATTATKGSSTPSVGSTLDTVRSTGSSSPSGSFAAAGARSSGAGASAGAGGGSSSGRGSDGRPQVQRFESSRPYLTKTGPKNKRRIILSFALSRAGRVYFVVKQVSPDCRIAGRFSVRGHKGVNRVPFRGKVRGKPLAPGTYLISATTRQSERILRVTVVVLERGTPTRAALRAARAANVCPPPSLLAASSGSFVGSSGAAELTAPAKQGIDIPSPGSAMGDDSPSKSPVGVLGAAVESIAADVIKPLAVILLGVAILLLALAALPKAAVPDPRLNDVLVRHRPEIAAAGAAAMVTGIIYFLIS